MCPLCIWCLTPLCHGPIVLVDEQRNTNQGDTMKEKKTAKITVEAAAHKRLKLHCVRTGERMGAAATAAIVEYLRKGRK